MTMNESEKEDCAALIYHQDTKRRMYKPG